MIPIDWTTRVRDAFARASRIPDDDVIEELAQHAAATYEAARADGLTPDDAIARVADHLARWCAEAETLRHRSRRPPVVVPPPSASRSAFSGLAQDVRYAVRLLRHQPRHAALSILTMALGIGSTTVLFSVTYGVLMKPLPWPNADRIVVLRETRGGTPPRFGEFTNAAYLAWREEATTIEHIAAWSQQMRTLTDAGEPERIRVTAATASLFAVLGARSLMGSVFTEAQETANVIVLSESLWRQRFAAEVTIVGKPVELDGRPYTVIGVFPDEQMYPDRQSQAIVPHSIQSTAGNYLSIFNAVALLRPGVTPTRAEAEGTARGRFAADTGMTTTAVFGGTGPIGIRALPLRHALTADVRRPLLVLSAAVVLLLMAATSNVAGLQLARTLPRTREMGIRVALGAGQARVTRQLLVEAVLLGIAGGAAGLVLTWMLEGSLPAVLPADFPRVDALGVDATVVTFALGVSVATSTLCGLLPAIRVRRFTLSDVLAEDGATSAGIRTRTLRARALIAAQVAIACVLLIGASLVGRSFVAMLSADRGFTPSDLLSMRLTMPASMYPAERRFEIVERLLDRLAERPGIAIAAYTSELPLSTGGSTAAFTLKSPLADGGLVRVQASPRLVSATYMSAVGMRIVAGRGFTDADTATADPGVVVNLAFARQYLGEQPLGAKLPVVGYAASDEQRVEATVIGVVNDVRYGAAPSVSLPELYYTHRQFGGRLPVETVTLLVRASDHPASAAATLRSVVREADPRLAADTVMPLDRRLLATLARPRLYAALLSGFGAFALIIAGVGLFALLSCSVSQRSRELAIRTALGARPRDVLGLVLRQGVSITAAGLVAGLLASAWLTQSLSSQLYDVAPHDTLTFVAVPIGLLAVAALASLLPALRAVRVDPLRTLREG